MGFFKAAARRSKRGYRGKLHRCNGGMEQARVLSRDLGGLSFGQDTDGNWGYKIGGADPVIPFSSISSLSLLFETGYNISVSGNPNVLSFSAPKTGQFFMLVHVSGRTSDNRHDHVPGSMEVTGCDSINELFHTFKNTHDYSFAGGTTMRGYIVKLTESAEITITTKLSTPVNYANAILFEL